MLLHHFVVLRITYLFEGTRIGTQKIRILDRIDFSEIIILTGSRRVIGIGIRIFMNAGTGIRDGVGASDVHYYALVALEQDYLGCVVVMALQRIRIR